MLEGFPRRCKVRVGWINGYAILKAWNLLESDLIKAVGKNKIEPCDELGRCIILSRRTSAAEIVLTLSRSFYKLKDVLKCFPLEDIMDSTDRTMIRGNLPKSLRAKMEKNSESKKEDLPVASETINTRSIVKTRRSSKHKLMVQERAEKRWREHPDVTIPSMAQHLMSGTDIFPHLGREYKRSTIEDWIREKAPNRKPGRRPKVKPNVKNTPGQ